MECTTATRIGRTSNHLRGAPRTSPCSSDGQATGECGEALTQLAEWPAATRGAGSAERSPRSAEPCGHWQLTRNVCAGELQVSVPNSLLFLSPIASNARAIPNRSRPPAVSCLGSLVFRFPASVAWLESDDPRSTHSCARKPQQCNATALQPNHLEPLRPRASNSALSPLPQSKSRTRDLTIADTRNGPPANHQF